MLYELTAALAISFRVDYDQENGMVTTLEIFSTERIYDHKFIINSEYYAITFDYVKPKEKGQIVDTSPHITTTYYTDLEGNRITKGAIEQKIYLVVEGHNLSGEKVTLNLSDPEIDFEYQGKHLTNDILENHTFSGNTEHIKLKVVEQKNE